MAEEKGSSGHQPGPELVCCYGRGAKRGRVEGPRLGEGGREYVVRGDEEGIVGLPKRMVEGMSEW